jgi:hypothetical protein
MSRDLTPLRRLATRQGWVVVAGGKHLVWTPPATRPDAHRVTTSLTPSDWRALQNIRADLRHAGLRLTCEKRVCLLG